MATMWFNKLRIKLCKRSFANSVILQCDRLIYELLEDEKNEARQKIQEDSGNKCFDVIRNKGAKEIKDFREELIKTVRIIVQSDDPIISMRKELIHTIHSSILNNTLFLDKFYDRRQELYKILDGYMCDGEIANSDEIASLLYIWSSARCTILRMLQHRCFEQTNNDDWFSAYSKACQSHTEMLFELGLAKKEERNSVKGLLFKTLSEQLEAFQKKLIGEIVVGTGSSS